MVDQATGIKAFVKSYETNTGYHEYQNPSPDVGNTNECYIEAVTDKQY